MNRNRTTQLLGLIVLLAAIAAVWTGVRFSSARASALDRLSDLERVRLALRDMSSKSSGALLNRSASADDRELNRRLRAATAAAGVSQQLASIEPGQPARIGTGDFLETPLFVRLTSVSLRQLTAMLAALSSSEKAMNVKSIELAPPADAGPATGGQNDSAERWMADLTLSYLVYAPQHQP